MKTIIKSDEIKQLIKSIKHQGKSIVVAGGCFDLLHIGHITLLENAKKQGDILIVLLENDISIKKKKGINRPIHSQQERAQMLLALRVVDYIILLPEEMSNTDYDKLLNVVKPTIIATTENDPYITHKQRQAKEIGAKVIAVNKYIPAISTSKLLDILSKEN